MEEPSPAIVRVLGDFMQQQAEQPRSQFSSHFLNVKYAYWDSELDYRWRQKDGEASVGREGNLKLIIYIIIV